MSWDRGGTKFAWIGWSALVFASLGLVGCGTVLGRVDPQTGTAVLSWKRPMTTTAGTRLTELAGYDIFGGLNPSALRLIAHIKSKRLTQCKITGLSGGMWYFVVTSYTNKGTESEPSNVVSKRIPGDPSVKGQEWDPLRWRCWQPALAPQRKG